MKFLLDESAEFRLAAHLQAAGHDVTAIAHDYPPSLKDRDVLQIAVNERRVVITNDLDFGELVVRHKLPHAGIVLFRLRDAPLEVKERWLDRLLSAHVEELRQIVVITPRGMRSR